MVKINRIKNRGTTIYPATIPQAVVNPDTQKNVLEMIEDAKTEVTSEQAEINTQLSDRIATAEERINDVELSMPDFGVGGWVDGDLNPDSVVFHGSKEFLADWRPYLIDTTDNAGKTTTPVGELMKNNWLRFKDGRFAPTVGITEAQRAECDVALYLDDEASNLYCTAGAFNAEAFYNEYGMNTPLYNSSNVQVRILRPWETTETKYTIGLGRTAKVYLLDNVKGKSGYIWKGLFSRPQFWDGIDVSQFPLEPTAIAPCPCCTVGGKMRNFFFLYEGETNCKSNSGNNNLCTMFLNGRTYPRAVDVSQISNMNYARANNADANAPYPFAEGGFHALNCYVTSQEVLHGTKYLHNPSKLGSGISSNDNISTETLWLQNGGCRYKKSSETAWVYGFRYYNIVPNLYINTYRDQVTFSNLLSRAYPIEQVLESQMAASFAVETKAPENTEFDFYGATYRYVTPTGISGLNDGVMNARVYKRMSQTISAFDAEGNPTNFDIEVNLRMSLFNGCTLITDNYNYFGGGYEEVLTLDHDHAESSIDFPVSVYVEPDQTKWVNETITSKQNLGRFDFENSYIKILDTKNLLNGYCKRRHGYSSKKEEMGGGLSTGECFYSYDSHGFGNTLGLRYRRSILMITGKSNGVSSPRSVFGSISTYNTSSGYAGSMQCLVNPLALGNSPKLFVNISSSSITAAAQQITLTVFSDVPWTLQSIPDWITNMISGGNAGSTVVTCSVAENTGTYRIGNIVIKATGYAETLTHEITQAAGAGAANPLVLSPDSLLNVPAEGGSYNVTVSALNSWSQSYIPNWIATQDMGDAGDTVITVYVNANTTGASRTDTVTFEINDTGYLVDFEVSQNG